MAIWDPEERVTLVDKLKRIDLGNKVDCFKNNYTVSVTDADLQVRSTLALQTTRYYGYPDDTDS